MARGETNLIAVKNKKEAMQTSRQHMKWNEQIFQQDMSVVQELIQPVNQNAMYI